MAIKAFSDDAFEVLTKSARNQSVKYYHTFCGSAHIFLGTLGFMKKHPEGYESIYNSLTEVLHKYNLSGKEFNEAFLKFAPQGEEPAPGATLNIVTDSDYNAIMTQLKNRAVKEARSMEVIDLIKELFSDKSYALYTIFQSMFQNEADVDNLYNDIARQFKTVVETVEELDQLGLLTNLTLWVKDHPVEAIGVDSNIDQLELALNGRSIKNAILTGPAGVGKTTVVYEFVQRLNNGQIGGRLEDKIVYQLDPGLLVAGSRFRGDFEQKLTNILEIVKDHPEIILFVDEGHMLVDLGGTSDGSVSAGNILKPYISRGEVQLILATTNEEYTQYILPEKAFKRRFHEVKISEPTREETIEILKGLVPTESKFFNRSIQEELIDKVVTLSNKYTLDEANPAKSINMLELACAYALVFVENREEVNVDDVIESVKLKYDIYISEEKYKDTKDELFKELLGQDDALNQVCRNLRAVEKGLCDRTKPMFSMLFAGPTGTGKTETAKIIARKFFGSDQNLIKINMGEYSAEMDVSKLTGSAKGYVGYDDEPALIKAVREKPNSVVLFD